MNRQAEEAAQMAEELHSQMFAPSEPTAVVEEEAVEETDTTEQPDEVTDEEVVPHDDDIEELRKFKARYLSLQGKYDAEVPRLHNELKEFKQSVFERLDSARQTHEEKFVEPTIDKFAKFKEEYGEDLFEAIKELAASQAEEKLNSSLKPVQEQVSGVEDAQIKAAQQNFVSYLDGVVKGDWQSLWAGNDPKFIEFLSKPDPSGLYTYGDLVQTYNDNWDADRLGKVFNSYIESQTPIAPPPPKQPNPAKEATIAPSRTNTHTTPSTNDKTIWTAETMKAFELADRSGKYTPEQSKAMWDDLLSAPMENRMR